MSASPSTSSDPAVPDWHSLQLPDTWPDRLRFSRPVDLWKLLRAVMGRRRRVEIPGSMPGAQLVPKYILQEFHHLPNGNYSKQFTHGYITGFDRAMLGQMRNARERIAQALRECRSALDVGTGGGGTAAMLRTIGVPDVWGLDPSPYLLQHAARRHPAIRFVQGMAEHTPFPDARFDGIAVCFVLHEIPPRQVQRCLDEFRRIIRPGGLLAICEPAPSQMHCSPWTLLRREGLPGLYFHLMARTVHEPFVRAWHRLDVHTLLRTAGFEPHSDEEHFPMRHLLARAC